MVLEKANGRRLADGPSRRLAVHFALPEKHL